MYLENKRKRLFDILLLQNPKIPSDIILDFVVNFSDDGVTGWLRTWSTVSYPLMKVEMPIAPPENPDMILDMLSQELSWINSKVSPILHSMPEARKMFNAIHETMTGPPVLKDTGIVHGLIFTHDKYEDEYSWTRTTDFPDRDEIPYPDSEVRDGLIIYSDMHTLHILHPHLPHTNEEFRKNVTSLLIVPSGGNSLTRHILNLSYFDELNKPAPFMRSHTIGGSLVTLTPNENINTHFFLVRQTGADFALQY